MRRSRKRRPSFDPHLNADDLVGVADAIADLLYVVHSAAITFGIPVAAVFAEVHRSNLTKLDDSGEPVYRADGKVMKGPNFSPPDLLPVLVRRGYWPRSNADETTGTTPPAGLA